MTCQPALSHAAQLVPLAKALRARGHDVVVATSAPYAATLRGHGLCAEGVGPGFLLREGDPAYERTVGARLFFGFIDLAGRETVADLLALARERRPQLVIREYAEFGGWIVARKLGLPLVTHGIAHRLPPPMVQRILAEVEHLAARAGTEPPETERELYGDTYLEVVPPSFRLPWERDEEFVHAAAPSQFGGSTSAHNNPLLANRGHDRPLVYVTLGTIFTHFPRVWQTILQAVADIEVDVLMTIGPDTDDAAFASAPPNVRVERFVPQSEVLPHSSAVVCHAGFNTLIGAFSAGVPSLCLPVAADQPLNAVACAAAGAGINGANSKGDARGPTVDPETLTPEDVRAALQSILREPRFRSASARIGQELSEMPSPGRVGAHLVGLVAKGRDLVEEET